MGSGLILLVIVGAWLAVLVPMALRSHDASNSLGGVDKFHDAMRVLSRRSGVAAAEGEPEPAGAAETPAAPRPAARSAAARRAAAARRRRLLLGLLATCVLTAVGAVVGPTWLLWPHLVVDLLLVAFVVQLRRTALRRAERDMQAAMRARPASGAAAAPSGAPAPAACAVRQAVHVVGVPSRMPPRPAPLEAPGAAPAVAQSEALPAARGAQGEAWSPVPVPAPTYLSAPTAPRRSVDLTRAGTTSDGLADAERELGIVDEGPQLDEILDRRRAVNDW